MEKRNQYLKLIIILRFSFSPRLPCAEVYKSKTTFTVCLSSRDVDLHSSSWHTGLMCTAWEKKVLWKSFSDLSRTARPACWCKKGDKDENCSTRGGVGTKANSRAKRTLLPWIHMAVASSRALNSQCKLSLVEGWRSGGSGGLSL